MLNADDTTSLTVMLCRMGENGLIFREVSASDGRESLISLTPKARELKKRYNQVSQQMNSLFFKDFEKEEKQNGIHGQNEGYGVKSQSNSGECGAGLVKRL